MAGENTEDGMQNPAGFSHAKTQRRKGGKTLVKGNNFNILRLCGLA
jgi:hypothetical protein